MKHLPYKYFGLDARIQHLFRTYLEHIINPPFGAKSEGFGGRDDKICVEIWAGNAKSSVEYSEISISHGWWFIMLCSPTLKYQYTFVVSNKFIQQQTIIHNNAQSEKRIIVIWLIFINYHLINIYNCLHYGACYVK